MPWGPLFVNTWEYILMVFPSVLKSGTPWVSRDHLRMKITHRFIGPRNVQISSLNNSEILIWPPDYNTVTSLNITLMLNHEQDD